MITAIAEPDMTLGEARAWLDRQWACACTGGPWCCIYKDREAKQLVKAAHIAVKQVVGLAELRSSE